jgi:hypothetical protein
MMEKRMNLPLKFATRFIKRWENKQASLPRAFVKRIRGFHSNRGSGPMSLEYQVTPEAGFLLVSMSGPYEASDAPEASQLIVEALEEHQPSKVLIDVLSVEEPLSATDRFYLSTLFSVKYIKERITGKIPRCRFAVVGKEPLIDPNRFGETVAVNRGAGVKAFTRMEKALAWLKVKPGENKNR